MDPAIRHETPCWTAVLTRGELMPRPVFTGSSLERVRICPASEALPHVRTITEYMERGNAIHAFLAEVGSIGIEEAISHVPEEFREACRSVDLERLPQVDAAGYAAEVAFAYDVELGTAYELGRNLNRAYPTLRDSEVPLTVDSVALCTDGESVGVWDYKSGRSFVPRAIRNAQLALGALAACRTFGRTRAEVAIVHIPDDGQAWFDRAVLDEWTLDAFAASLRPVAAAVREARERWAAQDIPNVTAGEHCRYCPATVHCPAQTALIRAASNPEALRLEYARALTPERAREAYAKWRMLKEIVNLVGDALESFTYDTGPINLGDGRMYGPHESSRDSVDGQIAHSVLERMHGRDTADAACSFKSSKAAIEEALKVVAANTGKKVAPLKREALAAIEADGGITKQHTRYVKEYTVKGD